MFVGSRHIEQLTEKGVNRVNGQHGMKPTGRYVREISEQNYLIFFFQPKLVCEYRTCLKKIGVIKTTEDEIDPEI